MEKDVLKIDGSFGEGGGSILRVALALSAIKKTPIHVFNIRAKRKEPGLRPQHLIGLRALAEICQGKLEGDEIGSAEIKFFPGQIKKERISIKIPTAGSITLVLQSLIPVCLFSQKPVVIFFEGGATDTFFSPTIDHFRFVFLKILEKMGAKIEIEIVKRGYYPEGGALLKAKIFPAKLKPINLTQRGKLIKILLVSVASELLKEKKVAQRQALGAKEILKKLKLPIEEIIDYQKTDCPGSSIFVGAFFERAILGSDNLGKLGVPAETIGKNCALSLLEEEKTQACLDRFLADQILIYMALSGKKCAVKVSQFTSHAKTNMWLIPQFIEGTFEAKENVIFWIPK